jgi:hypothetical protein
MASTTRNGQELIASYTNKIGVAPVEIRGSPMHCCFVNQTISMIQQSMVSGVDTEAFRGTGKLTMILVQSPERV